MPYTGQHGGKTGHVDLAKNPDVKAFLAECNYMKTPDDAAARAVAATYLPVPHADCRPDIVVASDASPYSQPIEGKFPSTQVGYVKVSLVLIDLKDFNGLTRPGSRFVNPFAVAALHRSGNAFAFSLPGTNVTYKNAATVQAGFRRAVWDQLSDDRTRFHSDPSFTVRGTLLALEGGVVKMENCPEPNCTHKGFVFTEGTEVQPCPCCGAEVYLTDTLRIHEQMTDFGDNAAAMTRFMNVVEHLVVATLVRMLHKHNPHQLAAMAFMVDGPLAIFGQPAAVHAGLQRLYWEIKADMAQRRLGAPLIIGLQKDGQVMEHARALAEVKFTDTDGKAKPCLAGDTFRPVDDDYRKRFISGGTSKTENFGHETYYGQDFIFKTSSGRVFVLALPYPFVDKRGSKAAFAKKKVEVALYGDDLARAFDLVKYFECDLYENSVVPVALAHRHASISLTPGGKVLDLVTRHGLAGS